MNRRSFMKCLGAVSGIASLGLPAAAATVKPKASKVQWPYVEPLTIGYASVETIKDKNGFDVAWIVHQ